MAWADEGLRKVKHMEPKYHFTQHLITTGQTAVKYVASDENVVDVMPKMLGPTRLKAMKETLQVA